MYNQEVDLYKRSASFCVTSKQLTDKEPRVFLDLFELICR